LPSTSTGVKRRRRPSAQKGVQAVFTQTSSWKERAQLAIGLAFVASGASSWIYSSKGLGGLGLAGFVPWNSNLSAILLPLSIPLLIGGVGVCVCWLVMRRTWRASSRIESALFELEALVGQKNGVVGPATESPSGQYLKTAREPRLGMVSKALAIAVAEAGVLLVIYSGLVREYASNSNMQYWVQANFAPGRILLTYNAVLVLTGILGALIFQLIPRRLGSKKIQSPPRL